MMRWDPKTGDKKWKETVIGKCTKCGNTWTRVHYDNKILSTPKPGDKKIFTTEYLTCDQVAWIVDILERYEHAIRIDFPPISRLKQVAKLAAMLELFEILHIEPTKDAWNNVIAVVPELGRRSHERNTRAD